MKVWKLLSNKELQSRCMNSLRWSISVHGLVQNFWSPTHSREQMHALQSAARAVLPKPSCPKGRKMMFGCTRPYQAHLRAGTENF